MACKPKGLTKSRIDVWKPKLRQVDSVVSALATYDPYETYIPAQWVTLETPDGTGHQKRGNALVGISITDSLYSPRRASLRITNRCNDYRTVYDHTSTTTISDTTYTHVYNNSDGSAAHSGGSGGDERTLPRNWGVFTNFFYPFQYIRVVDTETNLVLFSGRIHKIDKKYEDGAGSIIVLNCKDALEELSILSCKSLVKTVPFAANTRKSDVIRHGLNLGFNYHAANVKPLGGADGIQGNPSVNTLGSTYNITDTDGYASGTAAATNPPATNQNSYSRYEVSQSSVNVEFNWNLANSGAKSLLDELVRFAIAEHHEDETADDQFGYDFFVDSNIGSSNLSATVGPPRSHV